MAPAGLPLCQKAVPPDAHSRFRTLPFIIRACVSELPRVEVSPDDVPVVADGIGGIVQRSALQQVREKLVALAVVELVGA